MISYFKLPSLFFRRRKKGSVDLESLFILPDPQTERSLTAEDQPVSPVTAGVSPDIPENSGTDKTVATEKVLETPDKIHRTPPAVSGNKNGINGEKKEYVQNSINGENKEYVQNSINGENGNKNTPAAKVSGEVKAVFSRQHPTPAKLPSVSPEPDKPPERDPVSPDPLPSAGKPASDTEDQATSFSFSSEGGKAPAAPGHFSRTVSNTVQDRSGTEKNGNTPFFPSTAPPEKISRQQGTPDKTPFLPENRSSAAPVFTQYSSEKSVFSGVRDHAPQQLPGLNILAECAQKQLRYLRKNYELLKNRSEDRFFN